ncbi:hypothetical protein CR513_12053, partial [Mucuna pruriens]
LVKTSLKISLLIIFDLTFENLFHVGRQGNLGREFKIPYSLTCKTYCSCNVESSLWSKLQIQKREKLYKCNFS